MSDKITIVDGVSVPTVTTAKQSIPIGVNADQMGKLIQDAAAKAIAAAGIPGVAVQPPEQAERINPSIFMRDMTAEMEKLYQRFDALKLLATELNGKSTDEPLPPHVIFKGLTLDFAINKDDKVTDHSVKMQAISCIGDISNLMSNEFGYIIASLQELSKQVADLAQKTNDRCTVALKEWEISNKNKQVITGGPVSVSAPSQSDETAKAPITLLPQ